METSGGSRLEELLAVREIEQVILRLARATDRRDAPAIEACYHPDAFDDHGAFQGSPAEFAAWVPRVLAMFAATQHFLAPPRIELDGEAAHCETYCTAHHVTPPGDPGGERDSVMGLRYVDRFERRAGIWKIARRTCVWDYTYIVPVVEKWPFGPDYRLGRPDRDDPSYRR
jgi:ketosteroid isomerase-like protein